jgi:hypothetical protein
MRGWLRVRPLVASRVTRPSMVRQQLLLHAYGFRPGFVLGIRLHR